MAPKTWLAPLISITFVAASFAISYASESGTERSWSP